MVEIGVHLLKL